MEITILEALENTLTFLESLGYRGGDIHDDLKGAIQVIRTNPVKNLTILVDRD